MEYCPDCGEYPEDCTCTDPALLEDALRDPDTVPELNFETE